MVIYEFFRDRASQYRAFGQDAQSIFGDVGIIFDFASRIPAAINGAIATFIYDHDSFFAPINNLLETSTELVRSQIESSDIKPNKVSVALKALPHKLSRQGHTIDNYSVRSSQTEYYTVDLPDNKLMIWTTYWGKNADVVSVTVGKKSLNPPTLKKYNEQKVGKPITIGEFFDDYTYTNYSMSSDRIGDTPINIDCRTTTAIKDGKMEMANETRSEEITIEEWYRDLFQSLPDMITQHLPNISN